MRARGRSLAGFDWTPATVLVDSRIRPRGTRMSRSLQEVYNETYLDEDMLAPVVARPDAVSTNRVDDATRLLDGHLRGSLLEVGGSTGRFGLAFEKHFDRIVVTDIADRYIRMGEEDVRKNHSQIASKFEFAAVNIDEGLPYADASFDVVLALAVIEHVIDPFHALDEIARVTKPGGTFVMTVPNIAYLKHVVDLLRGRLPLTGAHRRDMPGMREAGWDGHHFHYFTKSSLGDLLRHTGFEPEVWTSDGKWAKFRRWWLPLCGNLTVRARRTGKA